MITRWRIPTKIPREDKPMDRSEFKRARKKINKTQKQMAQLLGVSLKAVHSYEQGWRVVPPAVERHLYFLVSRQTLSNTRQPCWEMKDCPPEQKAQCPAAEFDSGDMCWLINGSLCAGSDQGSWEAKMAICRSCSVFKSHITF
jgi:DNA-binding transcriptional regulator YiaG